MTQVQRGLLVARRELRDSLSDWRIVTPVALLTFVFPWLVMYAARFGINYITYVQRNPELVLTQLVPFSVMVVGFFPISFSLVIALESFVGEKERNTLESLLSTPITDGALYVGKLLAALALPLMGSLIAMIMYAVGLPWVTRQYVPLDLFVQIILLTTTLALGMVAGAVVVSSNTTSVRAANLLASFIVLPSMLMITFQSLVILWDQREVLWFLAIAQALADLALIRMGIRLFNREDLLARTIDRIDVRRALRTFWAFLSKEPAAILGQRSSGRLSLGRIYRRDIPQILRRSAGAVAVVGLAMLGAFVLGWAYAKVFPLPAYVAESLELSPDALREGLTDAPSVLGIHPMSIFFWNVRSVILWTLAGIISFGAASVVPLFSVSGIIGFLGGQAAGLGIDVGPFLALLWPHGLLEIPAVVAATAVGLRMGAAVLSPPKGFTLGETLLLGLADFVKVFIFLVMPLLLIAAFIEIYITPQIALWALGG